MFNLHLGPRGLRQSGRNCNTVENPALQPQEAVDASKAPDAKEADFVNFVRPSVLIVYEKVRAQHNPLVCCHLQYETARCQASAAMARAKPSTPQGPTPKAPGCVVATSLAERAGRQTYCLQHEVQVCTPRRRHKAKSPSNSNDLEYVSAVGIALLA